MEVERERVDEGQWALFTTDRGFSDASHHINSRTRFRYSLPPAYRLQRSETRRLK